MAAQALNKWRAYNLGTLNQPLLVGGVFRRDKVVSFVDSDVDYDLLAVSLGIFNSEEADVEEDELSYGPYTWSPPPRS